MQKKQLSEAERVRAIYEEVTRKLPIACSKGHRDSATATNSETQGDEHSGIDGHGDGHGHGHGHEHGHGHGHNHGHDHQKKPED